MGRKSKDHDGTAAHDELFGDVSRLYNLLVQLGGTQTVEKKGFDAAWRVAGMGPDTARRVIRQVTPRFTDSPELLADPCRVMLHPPNGLAGAIPTGLSADGVRLRQSLEDVVRMAKPPAGAASPPGLRVVVEPDPLLKATLEPVWATTLADGLGLVRPRVERLKTLVAAPDAADVLVRWEVQHPAGKPDGWSEHQSPLGQVFTLVLIASNESALIDVTKLQATDDERFREASWDRVSGGEWRLAVPRNFPNAVEKATGRMGRRAVETDSPATALHLVLDGEADFALLPFQEVLDALQLAGVLFHARLADLTPFQTRCQVRMLWRDKADPAAVEALRLRLQAGLSGPDCLTVSQLTQPVKGCTLPDNPEDYRRPLFSYYLDRDANDRPEWRPEDIELGPTGRRERTRSADWMRLAGKLVNRDRRMQFRLQGWVVRDRVLFLMAEEQRSDGVSGDTFVSFFPYCFRHPHEGHEHLVWAGVWLGQTSLRHAVAYSGVFATCELKLEQLNKYSRRARLLTARFGDHIWTQPAPPPA